MTPTLTRQLLTTGSLPGWLALLLFVALGALVCWHLHRELAGQANPRLLRILFTLRLAIVALALWLLCRPVLLVTERWREQPHLVVLTPDHPSLGVTEDFGGPHHRTDVLEAIEQRQFEGRITGASALARSLEHLATLATNAAARITRESEHLASALPPRPDFTRALPELKTALLAARDDLSRRQGLLPPKLANETLTTTRDAAASRLAAFSSSVQAAAQEVELTQTQFGTYPELLTKLAARLTTLAAEARRLATDWHALQAALDETAAATSPALKAARDRALTRRAFATAAAQHLTTARDFQTTHLTAPTLADGLRSAARNSTRPPTALLVLDDATAALTPADRAAATQLADAGIPIHTALIGADGFEPPDAGLIAVDLPGIVPVGKRINARALVKVQLARGNSARLLARTGETVLAQATITSNRVVELPLRFDTEGRHSVVFEIQTETPDAQPANQTFATVIDVVAKPPRVLVISDSMSADFVLLRGVAEQLPHLRLDALLLDPQLGKLTLGGELGQFPATPEQWQSVAALVLLGRPTTNLPPTALANLPAALNAGLHVLLFANAETNAWPTPLNLSIRPISPSQPLQPRPDLWLPFYSLARDESASLTRWQQLPTPTATFAPTPAGIPLLTGETNAPLQLLLRGRGGIIFAGLPDLASLRADHNAASLNRLLAELLELTARPWLEGDSGLVLFPPQPVAGRKQLAAFSAALTDVTGATHAPTPWDMQWLTPSPTNELAFTAGTQKFRRPIHQLLNAADFTLTAHAAPLEELSRLGHGRFAPLVDLPELLAALKLAPAHRHHVTSHRLWSGLWPLILLLLLVTTEYLLRRRAGRVM